MDMGVNFKYLICMSTDMSVILKNRHCIDTEIAQLTSNPSHYHPSNTIMQNCTTKFTIKFPRLVHMMSFF